MRKRSSMKIYYFRRRMERKYYQLSRKQQSLADGQFLEHWLCRCGHYIEDGIHCPKCGSEPPWGCPCDLCDSPDMTDDPEFWGYGDGYFDDDEDENFELAGYVCLICTHDQDHGGSCDNCESDQLEEIEF